MVHHICCCVVNCKNNGTNSRCKFYIFPKVAWKLDQRRKWIAAIKRKNVDGSPWSPRPHDTICSEHFIGGKKSDAIASPSYVPTIFPTTSQVLAYTRLIKRITSNVSDTASDQGPNRRTPQKNPMMKNMDSETTDSGSEAESGEDGNNSKLNQQQGQDKLSCNKCGHEIVGGYYACLQCTEAVLLCEQCEAGRGHARHYALRVPAHEGRARARALIARVRAFLPQGYSECIVKTEIKEEPVAPEDPLKQEPNWETDISSGHKELDSQSETCDISQTMVEIKVENIGVPAKEQVSDEWSETFTGKRCASSSKHSKRAKATEENEGGSQVPAAASHNIKRVQKSVYKYCFVPACKNTTETAPDKMFFSVPRGLRIRQLWCRAIGRDDVSPTSGLHCCEDHFNVEEDLDNYMRYKIMVLQQGKKNLPLRLKKGVVPHIFQSDIDSDG